jgi:D-allose transport system ATP-binding protein
MVVVIEVPMEPANVRVKFDRLDAAARRSGGKPESVMVVRENGAGKSTLMKVLSGIHEPTKGTITIKELNYDKLDHKLAAQLGIGIIYQELSVIDELTVLENLYIGRHLTKKVCGVNIIDWKEMRVRGAMMLLRVGLKIDLDEKVANLSISHKQMLEIAKTLMLDAKVIIMDEPTFTIRFSARNKRYDSRFRHAR